MTDPRSKWNCIDCFDRGLIMRPPTPEEVSIALMDPMGFHPPGKTVRCPSCNPEPKPFPPGRHIGHWDDTWMDLALSMASKSTCSQENRQVGCIIVPLSNEYVLGIGYNGGAAGDEHRCTVLDTSAVGSSKCACIHAEMNALAKMNPMDPSKKKMYLTLSPCGVCWKMIWNANIHELIYHTEYERDVTPLEELKKRGVIVRKYENNRCKE